MMSSLGTIKWLDVHQTQDPAKDYLVNLKKNIPELKIAVSDIHSEVSRSLYEVDWKSTTPCILVFGNEENGVSDEVKLIADESFYIPMKGFAESLNLSASVAVCQTV